MLEGENYAAVLMNVPCSGLQKRLSIGAIADAK
jgi:hypothetical protein